MIRNLLGSLQREYRSVLPLEEYLCGDDKLSNVIGCCDTQGLLELHLHLDN